MILAVPVRAGVLLTGFQTDWASLLADAVLLAVALGYAACTVALVRAGRRAQPLARASFAAGLLLLFVAVGSGLAGYDDTNFSAHCAQHVILMMMAPPLLCLGRPLTTAIQALPRRPQRLLVAVANHRLATATTGWPAVIAYSAVMWVYFLSPWYPFSEQHPLVHDATHVAFVLVGFLYWHGVLGLEGHGVRRSFAVRLASVVAAMPLEAALGFVLATAEHPLWSGNTLEGTRAGGMVFWTMSMFVSGAAIAGTLGAWAIADEQGRRAAGLERRGSILRAPAQASAAASFSGLDGLDEPPAPPRQH